MITAYATLKKACANANHAGKRLDDEAHKLIVETCDESLAGQHHDMFPLHVWMTGSGTQFNRIAGTPPGSKKPVHPKDYVNMSQSSNDTFPPVMYIAAAVNTKERLLPSLTGLPFVTAPNKFTVQGAHDALVQLSGSFRTLAVSLYKIANDIRLTSCGPRPGFAELEIPENEPGSPIMPGKVNPIQAEAPTMIAVEVMANDVAVGFGGASGYLEMNAYKPLMIDNVAHSITLMTDGCANFRKFLVGGTRSNLKKIKE